MNRPAPWVIPVAIVLSIAACGGTGTAAERGPLSTPTAPEPPSTSSPGAREAPPTAVPEVLRFEAPGLDGGVVRGAGFAGHDLAIWFWAPW